jgi:ABC-2 type transport system permease protein
VKGPALLLAHSLKRVRTLVVALALLLGGFQILLIVMAAAFHRSNSMSGLADLLPPFVREFFGPSLTAFISFGGMISQVYFHPMVMAALVALVIVIATMPAGEIESGFIDLVLSRPLARHWIITRSIVVAILCLAAIVVTMMIATWAGLKVYGPRGIPWPPPSRILSLALNLSLLMLAWSAVAMTIASASRRRGAAGAFVALLALATFLVDYAARVWAPAKSIAWLSPFHYYNALDLIAGSPLQAGNLLVLAAISVAGFGAAYALFQRRDLSK